MGTNSSLLANLLRKSVLLSIILLTSQQAYAATIVVNTFEDELNNEETCSLRQAVISANTDTAIGGCTAGAGEDTIVLSSGTYRLSIACENIIPSEVGAEAIDFGAECGDLDITSSLAISGAGKDLTIIEVGAQTMPAVSGYGSEFRAFHLQSNINQLGASEVVCQNGCTAGSVLTLSSITLQNGTDTYGGAVKVDAGGACSPSKLVTTDVIFLDNSADQGGAVYVDGIYAATNTTFEDNYSDDDGGAVYLANDHACSPENTITTSSFTANYADESGGAIFASLTTKTLIAGSTFTSNNAELFGAAIAGIGADITINDSSLTENGIPNIFGTVFSNVSPLLGGAIAVGDFEEFYSSEINSVLNTKLAVSNSIISGNQAKLGGGGIATFDGVSADIESDDWMYYPDAQVDANIRDSQINQNILIIQGFQTEYVGAPSLYTPMAGGGVLHAAFGKMSIEGTTIDSNSAATGGGVANLFEMSVAKSTISNNVADLSNLNNWFKNLSSDGAEEDYYYAYNNSGGGGIANLGALEVTNTTISGNSTNGNGAGLLNFVAQNYIQSYLASIEEINPDVSVLPVSLPLPGTRLNNVTVTNNNIIEGDIVVPVAVQNYYSISPNNGGGIASFTGEIALANTIVAGNTDNIAIEQLQQGNVSEVIGDFAPDCYIYPSEEGYCDRDLSECDFYAASIRSAGNNLIGNNLGCKAFDPAANSNNDKVGTNDAPIAALLSTLVNNGGKTLTHQPLQGSPAIDAGSEAAISTTESLAASLVAGAPCAADDQRSVTRPLDGDLNGVSRCDIGAVEVLVDCKGVPGGTAALDLCGVCGGDGTSCSQPADLTCKTENIFNTLISLDGSGHDLANLSNLLIKAVKAKSGNKKAAKKNKVNAEILRQEAWDNTWKIPTLIQSDCTGGAAICTTLSTEQLKTTYIASVTKLYDLNQSLLAQLKKLGGKKKGIARYQKLNDQYLATAMSTANNVPGSTVSCVQ